MPHKASEVVFLHLTCHLGRPVYADLLRSLAILGTILHRLALGGLESAAAGGRARQGSYQTFSTAVEPGHSRKARGRREAKRKQRSRK